MGQIIDANNRDVYSVFGMVGAAALGNYPTPLVGYGGSAVLGYVFCLSFMPGKVRSAAAAGVRSGPRAHAEEDGSGRHPLVSASTPLGRLLLSMSIAQ